MENLLCPTGERAYAVLILPSPQYEDSCGKTAPKSLLPPPEEVRTPQIGSQMYSTPYEACVS